LQVSLISYAAITLRVASQWVVVVVVYFDYIVEQDGPNLNLSDNF
jgi:hypothetical protein